MTDQTVLDLASSAPDADLGLGA
ncbi:MAG: hypothetical protein RLZ66_697, partial [Pseudomonadota bacterium]